jgi:regulator of PEP synthase PpsR (kinase-PPPase family)
VVNSSAKSVEEMSTVILQTLGPSRAGRRTSGAQQ